MGLLIETLSSGDVEFRTRIASNRRIGISLLLLAVYGQLPEPVQTNPLTIKPTPIKARLAE